MKKFNVNFQIDKVLELWQILSEKGYLCFDKITNVKIGRKDIPFNSRARIETALYRIEDTLNYMNKIELGVNRERMQAFDFYDFINCEVVVIDCIEAPKYCLGKLFVRSDDYRNRMEEIKDWINQYVIFNNTESYDETYALVTTALYLDSLERDNVLNWNIPNENKYRLKLLTTPNVPVDSVSVL